MIFIAVLIFPKQIKKLRKMVSPDLMTGLGAAIAIFLSAAGSSYATIYTGIYALRARTSDIKPLYTFFPTIIAGVLAIYGAIIGIILYTRLGSETSADEGYKYFSAGLTVGLGCLASGLGIGKFMQSPDLLTLTTTTPNSEASEQSALLPSAGPYKLAAGGLVRCLFVLVFIEAIGLYSLIVALFLSY